MHSDIARPGAIESALDHIETGASPSVEQAEALLLARDEQLTRLLAVASAVRDAGAATDGRPGVITYSKKVFIPLTTLCRDRCHYCIFVDTPGKLTLKGKSAFLSPAEILDIASAGAQMGCKEALFTLGDRPELRWPLAQEWLRAEGYSSTLDYVQAMGRLVHEETGLLPHFNPGVMTWNELQRLRPFAPSMGMMLETTSRELWSEKGGAHFGSPDKDPAVRLRVLEDAGRSRIPFTTGVLLGIGETARDRAEALFAIRESHARWGHIQEVIVQNFRTKPATAMQNTPDLETMSFVAAVAVARLVMGPEAHIQAPPNLTDPGELHLLVQAGIDDWGGVSPLTPDHVNPERPWPQIEELARLTASAGHELRERLTVYSRYIDEGWVDPRLLGRVRELAGAPSPELAPTFGITRTPLLARAERSPAGLSDSEYAELLELDGTELDALCSLADAVRGDTAPDLTFVANRNIDAGRFGGAVDTEVIAAASAEAWSLGATEVCVQGSPPTGIPPTAFFDIVEAVKRGAGGIHLHAFRVDELVEGASRLGMPPGEFVSELRSRGLDSVSGSGARILDDRIRGYLSGGSACTAEEWMTLIQEVHRQGLPSSATITYGHIESPPDIVGHLRRIVGIQDATAGFTEFVPLPFVRADFPRLVDARPGPSLRESRAIHAVARLMLAGRIDHIQAAWPKLGLDGALAVLRAGADDLGGLLMPGSYPLIGGEAGRWLEFADVAQLEERLHRPVRQRTTTYATADPEHASLVRDAERIVALPESLVS